MDPTMFLCVFLLSDNKNRSLRICEYGSNYVFVCFFLFDNKNRRMTTMRKYKKDIKIKNI